MSIFPVAAFSCKKTTIFELVSFFTFFCKRQYNTFKSKSFYLMHLIDIYVYKETTSNFNKHCIYKYTIVKFIINTKCLSIKCYPVPRLWHNDQFSICGQLGTDLEFKYLYKSYSIRLQYYTSQHGMMGAFYVELYMFFWFSGGWYARQLYM